jgi:fructokinase
VALFGGIETGGTTWELAVGTGPDDVRAEASIPTTLPDETIAGAVEFLRDAGPVDAVGIGSFGPVDVRTGSPTWGWVTTTPKPGWAYTDVAGPIGRELGVPVAFDTDVNAAALGEHRWGAAQGLGTFAYVTVGTGIGGGGMARGRLLHGLVHPEMGHLRIPDDPDDTFAGACPFHGDCWEGLAAAPALEGRWGRPPHELPDDPAIWALEARYVALGLVAIVAVLSPEAIVLGGGVMRRKGLRERVAHEVETLLAGYVEAPAIVAPVLAPRSGVLGALALAEAV